MMKLSCILALSACLFNSALGDDPLVQPLPDGIALEIGDQRIELRVATPHAFLVHICGSVARTRSIFLSGNPLPVTPFSVNRENSIVGLKTSFGELLIDTRLSRWRLRDSAGATLADWAALRLPQSNRNIPELYLDAGTSPIKPGPLYYGSGNSPVRGALTQTEAPSRTDNGFTSLPQYWSNAGYGALMISSDDNKPASWKSDADGTAHWRVPGADAGLYIAPAANLYDWLRDEAELTGFAPVPPRWAFGYMQSRWGWKDKTYMDDSLERFSKDDLPVDVFIVDFEWYTKTPDYSVPAQGDPDFVDFGWNPNLFPSPERQIADFGEKGLHIVGIRKPRVGNTETLTMARSKGWILPVNPADPNSANIRSRNIDFSNPEAREWWLQNNRKFVDAGMAGFWDDEGETTFTEYSYWNLTQQVLFSQAKPNARFWCLDRSFAPGVQRFGAAAWTGDIHSDWRTLAQTPGELLSYSLSGMPYGACDIGGYAGNPSPELLTRWMQAGVFFPVMRSHSELTATPRFPWLYGSDAENAIRNALELRYRLIPYYYSLAFQTASTGAPIMRPLVMEFPNEQKLAQVTDEWLMGKSLLAAPLLNEGGARDVLLPTDTWFAFETGRSQTGGKLIHCNARLDEIPLYVRAGSLLPLGPIARNTSQPSTEPLEMQIYPGRDSEFDFVEDDGRTLDYRNGTKRLLAFFWNDSAKTLSWKTTGSYHGNRVFLQMNAALFSPGGPVKKSASLRTDGSILF